ncbi:MAG: histidine kinase [Nocardioides sp.]|nr:histidine kinase [Nocardioides sp.]
MGSGAADTARLKGPSGSDGSDPFSADGELEVARARYARRLGRHPGLPSVSRLAQLAAQLTGSSSSQVSLISDVQVVVAGTGAALDSVGVDSPAADSLCTVTVEHRSPVSVDDAPHDDRVSDLPPVTSGVVGSYLGVPLHAGTDVVGALCVYNDAPRTWSAQDVALLEALAEPIVAELELAALGSEYDDDRVVWQLAIDAGEVGAFDWNLVTGELRWDERLLELFGLDRQTFGGTIEAFNEVVHPDDRERVSAALQTAISEVGPFTAEYRIVLGGGQVRWIAARGRALAGPTGSAVKVLGAASDTTAAQDAEARVARVLESMPSAFYHLDSQWRFTYANTEAKRLLGGVSIDIIGAVVWDLFPDARDGAFETQYRQAVDTGQPVVFEAYYPPPLDSWYEVRAWPGPDGLSVYFLQINDQHEARSVLERSLQRSALLADVTVAMSGTLESKEAVARLARLLVPRIGDWSIVTLADDAAQHLEGTGDDRDWRRGLRDAGWWHDEAEMGPLLEQFAGLRLAALTDDSFVARAVHTGRPVVVSGGAADRIGELLAPGTAQSLVEQLDPWSVVVVPLTAHDRLVGLLSVFRGRDRESFTPAEVAALEEVAGRAGLALDNTRLYREQRDLASELQQSMLTAPPEPDHLHVAVRYVPAAEAAQVGGDWYDAFVQRNGATVVVIGDVVGHDTAAAAAMGQLRSILRGIAVTTDGSPAEILTRVDEAMELLLLDTTATVIVARFEQTPEERRAGLTRLRWSNAGHPPPMVIAHPDDPPTPSPQDDRPGRIEHHPATTPGRSADSAVLWGATPNMLLGLMPETVRDETVLTLRRGATVLLYTDGLVERRQQDLDTGVQQLEAVFTELVASELPLEDLCDELLRRLLPERPEDDVALVAVRLHREDQPRPAEAGPPRVPSTVDDPPPV